MRNDKALRKNLEMPGHKKDLGVPPNRHTPLGVGLFAISHATAADFMQTRATSAP